MSSATNRFLPLILCMLFFHSYSQNVIKNYTKSDGLTSNTILTSLVDSKGIVWVGTPLGVCAFTGNEWIGIKSITEKDGSKRALGKVSHIYETQNGDIWVTAEKGIFIFNGEYWMHFHDRENDGFIVKEVFEDRRGWMYVLLEKYPNVKDIANLGFSIVEGVLQMYNGYQWHKFPYQIGGSAAVPVGDPNEYFTSHIQDFEGNIWVSSLDGVYQFDGLDWESIDDEDIPSDICFQVLQAKDSKIWVATKFGVAMFDGDVWAKFERQKGIKGNPVTSIFLDKRSRIWIITSKDNRFKYLCYYENSKWHAFSKDNIKVKGEIVKLLEFNDNILLFSKKGVHSYNNKNWNNLIADNNIDDGDFSNILLRKDKSILFTGDLGLYEITKGGVFQIFEFSDVWNPNFVKEDREMNIWVGTQKDGLFMISDGKVTRYNEDNGLPNNSVLDLMEDRDGTKWVVTKSGISHIITN